MSIINDLLTNTNYWTQICPEILLSTINNMYRNTNYHRCEGRNITDVLNATVQKGYYYSNDHINAYKLLLGICTLMLNKKPIEIIPIYNTIDTTQANTLTISDIYDKLYPINPTKLSIQIYHIPKGKTYLRNLLENTAAIHNQRIKQIETFCIENTQHFVRIYKDLPNTGPNSITVFTDTITEQLINTLTIMLPNLFDITEWENPNELYSTEEIIEHNKKVIALRNIFSLLFEIYRTQHTTTEIETEIKPKLQKAINEFTNLFNFQKTALNSFMNRLAKLRNEHSSIYLNQQLRDITTRIPDLEKTLSELYVRKLHTERAINAHKMLAEDDIKPLLETIQNTKAIEIMHTDEYTMKLRITAPLQYFTESDFEIYENNKTSTYNQNFANLQALKTILHKIFVTREYQILTQGILTLTLNENYYDNILNINAQRNSLGGYTEFPNPHLYHHNCFSAARNEINKNLCESNFELVVMQMIATIQTINVAETASFVNGFLTDIRNDDFKRITNIIDNTGKKWLLNDLINYETERRNAEQLEQAKQELKNKPKNEYSQIVLPDTDDNEELPF